MKQRLLATLGLGFALLAPAVAWAVDPIAVVPSDAEWAQQNHFSAPADLTLPAAAPLRVHGIESLNAATWGLDAALKAQFGDQGYLYSWSYESRPAYGQVRNQIHGAPADWAGIYQQNVIVDLGAGLGQGLSREQRCMLSQWVHDGGGLVLLGGYWTYGSGGGWAGTTLEDLCPVTSPPTTSLWEWNSRFFPTAGAQPIFIDPTLQGAQPVASPPPSPGGAPLQPVGANPITEGLDWEAQPLVMAAAKSTGLKPGAIVLAQCERVPVVVMWPVGKGHVVAVLAQPVGQSLGIHPAFWDWPDWPRFLGRLVKAAAG